MTLPIQTADKAASSLQPLVIRFPTAGEISKTAIIKGYVQLFEIGNSQFQFYSIISFPISKQNDIERQLMSIISFPKQQS